MKGNIKHGIYKSKDFTDKNGTRILKMGIQYSNERINNQKMERVRLNPAELKRFSIKEGNLIFSRTSMMEEGAGKVSIVDKHIDPIIFDGNLLCAELHEGIADPEFYYYYFKTKIAKQEILKITTGTQSRNISASNLIKVIVPFPSHEEQIAISNVLNRLDSKIELNHAMNCSLEAVGAALFRRWFVDFEFPNQEGKPYKTTGGKMQYNEELQMEIPENWTAKRVGDLAKINEHSINRDFSFSAIEYIDIDSVEQGLIKKRQLLTLKNAPSRAKRIVKDEDIIISTVRPNLKHFAFIQGAKANTIVSTGFAVISAKLTSPKLLYYHLTSDRYTNYLSAIADSHTSTYPSFNPDIIYNTLIAHPIEEKNGVMAKLILDFERLLSCVFQKIHNNNEQNSVLSMLRDALLPKLMSGKIRVPINKENVEMAVT